MQVSVNILPDELQNAANLCRAECLGAEVTALASPAILDSAELPTIISTHRNSLAGLEQISSHGPFLDLYATSHDPEIVQVCRVRHEKALRASVELSASIYVAHLNFLPLIRNKAYRENFADRAATFWGPLAESAWEAGVTIVLENMWEDTPEVQKEVVERTGLPGLKASFDNGHALVFSQVPAHRWIETLGSDLAHCHLHDNDRSYDSHLPVGDGAEDWPSLLSGIGGLGHSPMLVLESDTIVRNGASLTAFRRMTGPREPTP